MCKKTNFKTSNTHIDKCMRSLIKWLNTKHYVTVASCCGHGKYPITVVAKIYPKWIYVVELFSRTQIPRKRKFYKKDKQGYYYIPEIQI